MAESPITMFGVYVSNLSVSLGWGGQGGSMQLTLVEDESNGVVLEKDSNGYPFFGSDDSPQTGTACYFKFGDFYFGGVFQRWTYKYDATGGRTYDVVLESPSKYLDGVYCIIENFNGATDYYANQFNGLLGSSNLGGFHATYGNGSNGGSGSLYNVFNLFGAYENPFYGPNPFNNFGNSGFNSEGMPVGNVLNAMEILIERGSNEPFGGPIILGETENGQAATEYGMNLSKLEDFFLANNFTTADLNSYGLKGPAKSVNGIIGELAELFQFDYYWDIQPDNVGALPEGGGRLSDADIHLRVVDKTKQPEENKVREFIESNVGKGTGDQQVMNYSVGKEFATSTTQKIVWGARRTRFLELSPNLYAYAVLGRQSTLRPNSYNIVAPASTLDNQTVNGGGGLRVLLPGLGFYNTSPFELRMSMLNKEAWQNYKIFQTLTQNEPNGYNNILSAPWAGQNDFTGSMLSLLNQNLGNAFDVINTNYQRNIRQWQGQVGELADKIYSGLSGLANSSYKQEYFVRLPAEISNLNYNIYYPTFVNSSGGTSYESQSKKAWDVASSAYIPYNVAPSLDVSFFDASGKCQSCVGYPTTVGADYSSLGSDYALGNGAAFGTVVSKKGGPEGDSIWFANPFDGSTGSLYVLFKTGSNPKIFDGNTTPDYGLTVLAGGFYGINIQPERYIGSGKASLQFGVPPDVMSPTYFGIPQESQRFNYGPWVTLVENNSLGLPGFYSPYGLAEATETSLAPETYGSYDTLQIVGSVTAAVANTELHQSESGYVQMTGAPLANIGERFQSTGPYVTNMDISVDATGGVTTTYKFNTWTPEFSKLAKYNIDRIAKTNKTGWEIAQKNRGQITKPPFPKIPFEKSKFEELQKAKQSFFDVNGIKAVFKNVSTTSQSDVT